MPDLSAVDEAEGGPEVVQSSGVEGRENESNCE